MTKVNYNTDKEDKWYQWQGQKPPERIPHMTDEERDELMHNLLDKHTCNWIQRGNYIVCEAGEQSHGKNIGVGKMLDKEETDSTGRIVLRPFGARLRE